jgi:hypothetical protein
MLEDCVRIRYLYLIKKYHNSASQEQKRAFREMLYEDIRRNSPNVPKTQIMFTLLEISDIIANIRKECPNSRIVLVLVSDMLENSDTITFYTKRGIYVPENQKSLLKAVMREGLMADLSGVDVYIIGLGYLKGKTIPERQLIKLVRFWKSYFRGTKAKVMGIGTPFYPLPIK